MVAFHVIKLCLLGDMIKETRDSLYNASSDRTVSLIGIIIQGVSRLVGITAGGDFLGLCDQKSSYKHVSDFVRLRSYDHFLIPVHALV